MGSAQRSFLVLRGRNNSEQQRPETSIDDILLEWPMDLILRDHARSRVKPIRTESGFL